MDAFKCLAIPRNMAEDTWLRALRSDCCVAFAATAELEQVAVALKCDYALLPTESPTIQTEWK